MSSTIPSSKGIEHQESEDDGPRFLRVHAAELPGPRPQSHRGAQRASQPLVEGRIYPHQLAVVHHLAPELDEDHPELPVLLGQPEAAADHRAQAPRRVADARRQRGHAPVQIGHDDVEGGYES